MPQKVRKVYSKKFVGRTWLSINRFPTRFCLRHVIAEMWYKKINLRYQAIAYRFIRWQSKNKSNYNSKLRFVVLIYLLRNFTPKINLQFAFKKVAKHYRLVYKWIAEILMKRIMDYILYLLLLNVFLHFYSHIIKTQNLQSLI